MCVHLRACVKSMESLPLRNPHSNSNSPGQNTILPPGGADNTSEIHHVTGRCLSMRNGFLLTYG